MQIDKAIEILTQDLKDQFNNNVFGLNVAKALAIEALERELHRRERERLKKEGKTNVNKSTDGQCRRDPIYQMG